METSEILELFVTILTFLASAGLVVYQLIKNRKLETVKYLSMIRKEIWELTDNEWLKDVKDEGVKRAVKQKLEYIATAVNDKDLSFELVKRFCGKWFQACVRILKVLPEGNINTEDDESYEEMKIFYKNLENAYSKEKKS